MTKDQADAIIILLVGICLGFLGICIEFAVIIGKVW